MLLMILVTIIFVCPIESNAQSLESFVDNQNFIESETVNNYGEDFF